MEISVAEYDSPNVLPARPIPPRCSQRPEAPAPLRVLHVAAELYPWVKTGGLGDVMAALPPALGALGTRCPARAARLHAVSRRLRADRDREAAHAVCGRAGADRAGAAAGQRGRGLSRRSSRPSTTGRARRIRPRTGPDWPDNHRRFALLGWVAAALAQGADPAWRPDLLHCHDWHAGLAPAYLRAAGRRGAERLHRAQPRVSGIFPGRRSSPIWRLPPGFFSIDGVEFYGGLAFIKAGLFYADRLTTVSPTYAREIQTPAFGWGLDGLLRTRAGDLTGILNGVDPAVWSPEDDPLSAGSLFGR